MMKTFILYTEQYPLIEGLSDAQLGQLFRALYKYAEQHEREHSCTSVQACETDGNQEGKNVFGLDSVTAMAFGFIRNSIDAGVAKYEAKCLKNKEIAVERERKKREARSCTSVYERERASTNVHHSNTNSNNINKESISINRNTKEKDGKNREQDKAERAKVFYNRLIDYVDKYGAQMVREFYDYWTESNEGGARMRFEMEKVFDIARRLATWSKRSEKTITSNGNKQNANRTNYQTATERLRTDYANGIAQVFAVPTSD
jgi:hypothetical protein